MPKPRISMLIQQLVICNPEVFPVVATMRNGKGLMNTTTIPPGGSTVVAGFSSYVTSIRVTARKAKVPKVKHG